MVSPTLSLNVSALPVCYVALDADENFPVARDVTMV